MGGGQIAGEIDRIAKSDANPLGLVTVGRPCPIDRLNSRNVAGLQTGSNASVVDGHHFRWVGSFIQPQRVARLVQNDAVEIISRADVEIHGGVDLDVSRGRRAIRGWKTSLCQGDRGVGKRITTEADVTEPRVSLSQPKRVVVVRSIGNRNDVDIGHGLPGRQGERNLPFPDAAGPELGIEGRIQVIDAVVPPDSIGGNTVGDMTGVRPALPGENIVVPGGNGHERPLLETVAAESASASICPIRSLFPELLRFTSPFPAHKAEMLSEQLEDEPWHDPLRHSLGASRSSGVPVLYKKS